MNRRRVLALLSAAGLPTIAGCGTLFGPDPDPITNRTDGGGSGGAVRVTKVEGIDTDGSGALDTLRTHVILARGSGAVDLSEASFVLNRSKRTIRGDLEQQSAYLEGGGNGVAFERADDRDTDSTVLQTREDKIIVVFDLTAIGDIDPLAAEAGMTLELETAAGSTVSQQLQAPGTITTNETYLIQ